MSFGSILKSLPIRLLTLAAVLSLSSLALPQNQTSSQTDLAQPSHLDGITFASLPGRLYVPLKDLGHAIGEDVSETDQGLSLAGHQIHSVKHLFSGEGIVPVRELEGLGAEISWDQASQTATVQYKTTSVQIHQGAKRVVVDKSSQSLMAYQGDRLVLSTHVSTGREGHGTPNGDFTAGPAKERMHRSKLYHFAPMPWSVQVDGNVFIHGYTSVPNRPASHGCIRVPLTRGNPAHYFFNWVDVGTPVTIQGAWSDHYAQRRSHSRYAVRHRHRRSRYAANRRGRKTRSVSAHGADTVAASGTTSPHTIGIGSTTP